MFIAFWECVKCCQLIKSNPIKRMLESSIGCVDRKISWDWSAFRIYTKYGIKSEAIFQDYTKWFWVNHDTSLSFHYGHFFIKSRWAFCLQYLKCIVFPLMLRSTYMLPIQMAIKKAAKKIRRKRQLFIIIYDIFVYRRSRWESFRCIDQHNIPMFTSLDALRSHKKRQKWEIKACYNE